ncbi:MAG: phospho-sugar mutase, partial [Clostridia bacterium]|nr:phospho-sugar mutase [Clostridia bacterium]
ELYKEFGTYQYAMLNIMFEGEKGMIAMKEIMDSLRANHPTSIAGKSVVRFTDYGQSVSTNLVTGEQTVVTLPKSNVLVFELEGNASVIFRPSGTEPKVKSYITATGENKEVAAKLAQTLKDAAEKLIKG